MNDENWICTLDKKFKSDTKIARQLLDELLTRLSENGWAEEDTFGIHLATEEALMNAIKHGNQRDETKSVTVIYKISPTTFYIEIADEGPGFDPNDVPDPTLEENLEIPSGRGLMLMRTFMTKVDYNDIGNHVRMLKTKAAPE